MNYYNAIFTYHIDLNGGITLFLSFIYTGVINYEEKDDTWMATLYVIKDLESYLKVIIVHSNEHFSIIIMIATAIYCIL